MNEKNHSYNGLFQKQHRQQLDGSSAINGMDPVKLELIRLAAKQTAGKSGRSLAPVMMALITSANKKGIQFTPQEMSLILDILKEGRSREEQNQIDQMVQMVRTHMKNNT